MHGAATAAIAAANAAAAAAAADMSYAEALDHGVNQHMLHPPHSAQTVPMLDMIAYRCASSRAAARSCLCWGSCSTTAQTDQHQCGPADLLLHPGCDRWTELRVC